MKTGMKQVSTEEYDKYRQKQKQIHNSKYRSDWKYRLRMRLNGAKQTPRHFGLVTITLEELMQQLEKQEYRCYYSGIPLDLSAQKEMCPSLDRLDSSKSYVPGNVVICLWCINRAKSNMTEEEFLVLCKTITRWQEKKKIYTFPTIIVK